LPVETVYLKKIKKDSHAFAVPDLAQEIKARAAGEPTPDEIAASKKKIADAGLGL
jgi:hypothetical protein